MKGFTVYRSSAGSGKTYTLVKTYLTLLFSINNDYGFKQILGITFTNKAADEMKNRVFEALEAITKEGVNNSLAIEISKENNFKLNEIVHRAENIFYKILHNYADFNLMTIDKFTNQVIRAFANELGLSSSYEVILEEIDFLEQAVSDFVDQAASDSFHLDLIQNLIDESIRQGAQNDIEKQLKKLNKIIFDSDLEQHSLLDEKELLKLRNHVVSEIKNCENQIKIFCNDGNALILQNSIEISWQSYGRLNKVFDAFNQFQKLNIQELEKWDSWLENDQWFKKSLNSNQLNIITALKPEIESVVSKIIDFAKKWLKLIEVHKFITPFSMVQALINTIEIKKKNNNSILISDFNFLVSDIIKQEPAGFIFERIGSRYQYILVDEFQDTSSMQWENLVPLIHESISNGGKNLIVGDAKQAIYRWRKGNVKQFLDLPYLGDSYLKSNYELLLRSANNSMVLDDNWRSSKNFVEFNKWLFNKVANSTGSQNVIDAYKDVSQNFKRDFDGDVNVILKPKEGFDLNNYLKLNIDSVLSIGYQYKDIAILVRSKNDGLKTINSLQEIDIPFISEDSIFLSSSVSYKLMFYGISYFEFNRTKDFKLLLHFLSIYYKNQKNDFEEIKTTLSNLNFDEYHQLFDFQKLHYCSNILKLGSDDPYVEKFLDTGLEKIKDDFLNIGETLDYFIEKAEKIVIETASINAIQLTTIHKSKGLEFPIVIVPFGTWPNRNNSNPPYIWLEDIQLPSKILKNYIGEMSKKSLFSLGKSNVFEKEENASVLDNLNLFYVAFTRAADKLFVAMDDSKNQSSVADLMVSSIKDHELYDAEKNEIKIISSAPNKNINNIPIQAGISLKPIFPIYVNQKTQNLLSKVESSGVGSVFHEAMSRVYSNFDAAFLYLDEMLVKLNISKKIHNECIDLIQKVQNDKSLDFIFNDNESIYNEREIINIHGELLRIDRVIFKKNKVYIIDYKTNSVEKQEHINQVSNYISSFKSIGFDEVFGYLLYVPELILKEVI